MRLSLKRPEQTYRNYVRGAKGTYKVFTTTLLKETKNATGKNFGHGRVTDKNSISHFHPWGSTKKYLQIKHLRFGLVMGKFEKHTRKDEINSLLRIRLPSPTPAALSPTEPALWRTRIVKDQAEYSAGKYIRVLWCGSGDCVGESAHLVSYVLQKTVSVAKAFCCQTHTLACGCARKTYHVFLKFQSNARKECLLV